MSHSNAPLGATPATWAAPLGQMGAFPYGDGANYALRPASHEDVRAAQSHLSLLKSKMQGRRQRSRGRPFGGTEGGFGAMPPVRGAPGGARPSDDALGPRPDARSLTGIDGRLGSNSRIPTTLPAAREREQNTRPPAHHNHSQAMMPRGQPGPSGMVGEDNDYARGFASGPPGNFSGNGHGSPVFSGPGMGNQSLGSSGAPE